MKREASIEIAAPPEKVWSYLTEREKVLQWAPAEGLRVERFDWVGEQQSGVGATFYAVQKVDARIIRLLCEVTEWVEKEKFALHLILGDQKRHDENWAIQATESGSKLTLVLNIVLPYRVIGKIYGLFVRGMIKRTVEKQLANLKKLAEA